MYRSKQMKETASSCTADGFQQRPRPRCCSILSGGIGSMSAMIANLGLRKDVSPEAERLQASISTLFAFAQIPKVELAV